MSASAYRFGPFLLDRRGYRLLRGTEAIPLTPQLLDLLLYLVDHAGRLVTKEELLDALWPNMNVTENAVAHAVSELRQALGDNASAPRFIKTIARRGYRFIAPIDTYEPSSSPALDRLFAAGGETDPPTIAELQDQIVTQLLTNLGIVTPRATGYTVGRRDTASLAAYRAYVEGWLRLETLDVRDIPAAVADFERAIDADPRYALAYAGLATAEFALYEQTRADSRPAQDRLDCAIAHGRYAVQLDEHLAEAHATLALILVSAWKTEEAVRAARRAVALEPGNWRHLFRLGHAAWGDERLRAASNMLALYPDFAYTHFQMAMVHVARGHLGDAETVLRHGAAVQDRQIGRGGRYPALGLHWQLGLVRMAQHDPADALHEFERELAVADPHRLYGREYAIEALYGRGSALLDLQRVEQAIAAFGQALDLDLDHVPARLALVRGLRLSGQPAAVDSELARVDQTLTVLATTRPLDAPLMRARRLVACTRLDESIQLLEQFLAHAPSGFAAWSLPIDPLLRPLHGSEGFDRVLRRLASRAA
jgi:DNA-binding winged helix-turn-helix (wHTH) protein